VNVGRREIALDGSAIPGSRPAMLVKVWVVVGFAVCIALAFAPGAQAAAPEVPQTNPATGVLYTTATVSGVLNPAATGAPGEYSFTYGTGGSCTEQASEWTLALGIKEEPAGPVELSGLTPGTQYTFCLVERDEEGEVSSAEPERTFTTRIGLPVIASESVSEVTGTSAKLEAEVDPAGGATTYHFQYGTSDAYEASTPESLPIGSDNIDHGASAAIEGLKPGTVYHYRVVASNPASEAEGTPGKDRTFMTPSSAGSFVLPDNRKWELVSPPDKHGASIKPIAFAGGDIQSAEEGGAITYVSLGPIVSEPEGNTALEGSQVLSRRGPDGWSTQDLAAPHKAAAAVPVGLGFEYKLFSGNLAVALTEPSGETPLPAPSAREPAAQTIYLRDDATSSYQPVVTEANVIPGAKLGEVFGHSRITFAGASPNLEHIVFSSYERLTAQSATPAAEEGGPNLYEWSGATGELGEIKLASMLPGNELESLQLSELGTRETVRDAVSSDGSRVVWAGESNGQTRLYLSDLDKDEAVRADAPEGVSVSGNPDVAFQGANSEGTRIFFTDQAPLLPGANGGSNDNDGDLYVYEAPKDSGRLAGALHDLTLDSGEAEASVRGNVIGYGGEDQGGAGESFTVYFVDNGVLSENPTPSGAKPVPGGKNLYFERFTGSAWGPPHFIATLSDEDAPTWDEYPGGGAARELVRLTAGVSPSGRYLAFMSEEPLTGYDNRDVNSGVRDEEVFLYDAQSEALTCASCDPSGARPEGVHEPATELEKPLLIDEPLTWEGHWLAGSLPGWTPNIASNVGSYQSRYITNAGRLFFDSADNLVPADVNGKEDVYEYEPQGPTCSAATQSKAQVLSSQADGCVGLISSGTSTEESAFLDASGIGPDGEEGEDVFFLTAAQLTSQDTDSAFDVYDAHECSGLSPCPEPAVTVAPACNTADSCRAAPAEQPTVFGAPSSATLTGQGNPPPTVKAIAKAKPKPLTRAQKLTRALKACAREPKRKRPACKALARKRYGPAHKAKKSSGRNK